MVITIMDEDKRFGVRVAAIIFNKDKTKVFMQRQSDHDYFMFPGGRIDVLEDSKTSMLRELDEELNIINEDIKLKYICENFIDFKKGKYHEIGFYYVLTIDEEKYGYYDGNSYASKDEEHDGKSEFRWINIKDINDYKIMPDFMKSKLDITTDNVEHLVYKEF